MSFYHMRRDNSALAGPLASHSTLIRQIMKFSTAAKLTHARYGTSSQPAIFERWKNATVVATTASHNTTISANAPPGWCIPKKIHDQAMLSRSCTANKDNGIAADLKPAGFQTSQAAIAIRT